MCNLSNLDSNKEVLPHVLHVPLLQILKNMHLPLASHILSACFQAKSIIALGLNTKHNENEKIHSDDEHFHSDKKD